MVIIRESGDFYLVDYNLQIGYMAKGYVTFKERENVELGYGKVVDASVNMRAKPDPASDLAATLNAGDKAYIIGFNCGWYKVQYNGLTGYIRSDLLELTEKPKTNTGGAVSAGQQLVDLAKQYLARPMSGAARRRAVLTVPASRSISASSSATRSSARRRSSSQTAVRSRIFRLAIWCFSTIHIPRPSRRHTSASTPATISSSTRLRAA